VFYSLALTFGTLLSSQGTEASFETVSPAPPGFPFVFPTLPDPFRVSALRFRPPAGAGFLFRAFRRVHYFSGFPSGLLIEPFESNSGKLKLTPPGCRAVVVAAGAA
jgi:hypothetical protein